jgi:hypothetical protein
MTWIRPFLWAIAAFLFVTGPAGAANHREAPITALDHKADITDVYAFVSYGDGEPAGTPPSKATIILCVDPLLEPANGPTWFPFDPSIRYEIRIDNDHDADEDIVFRFRFSNDFQLPDVYTALAGFQNGAHDPETGALQVPPQITGFDNPGLNFLQSYTVTMSREGDDDDANVRLNEAVHGRKMSPAGNVSTSVRVYGPGEASDTDADSDRDVRLVNRDGTPFRAVPANAGPRTMDYAQLFDEATYADLNVSGISVFAGTVDDPFWIDLGAAFDTGNFRTLGSGVPAVLTDDEDTAEENFASDTVSGYAVNAIAIEVPIELLTRSGRVESPDSPDATIGVWGVTSRPKKTIRRSPSPDRHEGSLRQVQRMGNPLINELLVGIGSKDRFSMDRPDNDEQFARFFLDPPIAQIVEALYNELLPGALDVPEADRTDLLPLVTYAPPIAAPGTPGGPIADLLRLNTGVAATLPGDASFSRLGLIGGDPAGYPNGRRLQDDVVDITLRVGVGGILISAFNKFPNNRLGDGVNVNDAPYRTNFPYLADCPSGRNRRHVDPGEDGGGPVDSPSQHVARRPATGSR